MTQQKKNERREKGRGIRELSEFLRTRRYALLLLYFPIYLVAFFTIDKIPARYIISCALDNYIPFNQYMIIPYAIWYPWFTGWLLYFLVKDRDDFIKLAVVMFSGMTICLIIYVLWPNGVDLREEITGTDICSRIIMMIRETDTPYAVCPSIHISTIGAIQLVINDSKLKDFTPTVKAYCMVITLLIAYSTMAIKQHSVVDVFWGAVLSLGLYYCYKYIVTKRAYSK